MHTVLFVAKEVAPSRDKTEERLLAAVAEPKEEKPAAAAAKAESPSSTADVVISESLPAMPSEAQPVDSNEPQPDPNDGGMKFSSLY